jgi:hypothetical protein
MLKKISTEMLLTDHGSLMRPEKLSNEKKVKLSEPTQSV